MDKKTWRCHYNKVTKGNTICLLQAPSAVILFSVRVNSAGTACPHPWLQQPLWDPSSQGCPTAAVPLLHPLNSSTMYQETFQYLQRLPPYSNLRPTDISFMSVLMHQPNSLYSLEFKYRTWQTTAPAIQCTANMLRIQIQQSSLWDEQ